MHKLNIDRKKRNRSGRSGRLGWSGSAAYSQVKTSPALEFTTIVTQPSQFWSSSQSRGSYRMVTFTDARGFFFTIAVFPSMYKLA